MYSRVVISEIVRVIPVHGALHWTLDSPGPGARHAPVHGAAPGHGVRLGDEDEGRLLQERDPDAGLNMLRNNGHYGRRQKRAQNASFLRILSNISPPVLMWNFSGTPGGGTWLLSGHTMSLITSPLSVLQEPT